MSPLRPLILDLDGTLLHPGPADRSVVVPGRTRPSYLAGATIDALRAIGDRHRIFLATARSWAGTRPVVEGLAARRVAVEGLVLEDGGLFGRPGECRPMEPDRRWGRLRAEIDRGRDPGWPGFEWQVDFEACLVARLADPGEAAGLLRPIRELASRHEPGLRGFRDGRKLYLAAAGSDKWRALRRLLGDSADSAVGIGDGPNDLCWLSRVATPCTLRGADPGVVAVVSGRGGLLASGAGHGGIVEILGRIARGTRPPPD